nr:ribonuclease H-like domain-containing protein [Tanacetum cinerariifolium]
MFGLYHKIHTLKQNSSCVDDYYHKLNALWKQFDAMIELPKCVCNASKSFKKHNQLMKLMQFLMGLDDSYMQIRSSILSREVLSDVRSSYATISSEESHKAASGSVFGSSLRNQASAFVSILPNRGNFQRGGQVSKGKNVSNNSVRSSSSSRFTDGQMATLISFIKDNKVGKSMQANMAGHESEKSSRIGNQCGGLHYFNVEGIDTNVCNSAHISCLTQHDWHCRLGHPADSVAKQTRELFPLSDHNSSKLGDLIHLDLWGPCKVTSSEGFRLYSLDRHQFIFSRDVKFFESMFPFKDSASKEVNTINVFQDLNHIKVFDIEYPEMPYDDERDEQVTTLEDNNNSEASKFSHWIDALDSEMDALIRNDTWEIVDLPKDRKAIGSKWIFMLKYKSSGEIDRYKTRLVAQGFSQKEWINYDETFSHVVKMVTVRCLLNVVVSNSWHVYQLDVNNAFLYGDLVETVYMKPPEGYFSSKDK